MKSVLKILIGLIVITILGAGTIFFLAPGHVSSEQSLIIFVPKKLVFDQVNNLENWKEWSPWNIEDPSLEYAYGDIKSGTGASYLWKGEESAPGSMEIISSSPFDSISITEKIEGYSDHVTQLWKFQTTEKGFCYVTWKMDVDITNPIKRILSFFGDPQAKLDETLVAGLDALKIASEHLPKHTTLDIETVKINDRNVISILDTIKYGEINTAMAKHIKTLTDVLEKANEVPDGAPFCIWHESSNENQIIMELGLPVNNEIETTNGVEFKKLPSTKALTLVHQGNYSLINTSYKAIYDYMKENEMKSNGAPWDIYLNSPNKNKESDSWTTQIVVPIQ